MKGLLFTYALTYGGSVAALIDPFAGLLIYITFAIIRPESLWHWSVPSDGNYSRIVAIGLLAGWGLNGFGSWQLGRAKIIVAALLCYFGWSIVSAPFAAADSGVAWIQVEEYAKVVLPFLVGITTIRTLRQLKQLAWVIVLCEGYLAYQFNLDYYTSPYFDANDWTFATLDRNGIAITMVTSLGLAGFMGLYAENKWQKLVLLCSAGLMVHVVLFSMSRGGMVALIVTALVALVLVPKRPAHMAWLAVGLIIALRLAGPQVMERFGTSFASEQDRDYSAESRVELWGACINVMLEHPIFGIGSQNWRFIAHRYGFTPGKDAHTMWLHVGAELGIMGLAFLLLFYLSCIGRLWSLGKPESAVPDPWFRYFAHMVIASLVGFAVSAQFVSVFGIELPFYVVLLGAGTLKLASYECVLAKPEVDSEALDRDEQFAVAL